MKTIRKLAVLVSRLFKHSRVVQDRHMACPVIGSITHEQLGQSLKGHGPIAVFRLVG